MAFSLSTSKAFTSGTGISSLDLRPLSVRSVDPSQDAINKAITYEPSLYPTMLPGFFYVQDAEFYWYSRKCTEFLEAQYSAGTPVYLALNERPFGFLPYIQYTGSKSDSRLDERGMAPIIVRRHPKSDVFSKLVTKMSIYHDTGVIKTLGYVLDPSSNVSLGDIKVIPENAESGDIYLNQTWGISPLTPYALCYSYWRNDAILRPDSYYYSTTDNTIVLLDETDPDQYFYVVEYEAMNTSFYADYDLNPMVNVPSESNCLVIRINETKAAESEIPASLVWTASDTRVGRPKNGVLVEPAFAPLVHTDTGESIQLSVRVLSEQRNAMSGIHVTFTLGYRDVNGADMLLSGAQLCSTSTHSDAGYFSYYRVAADDADRRYSGRAWTSSARVGGYAYIPAAGYFGVAGGASFVATSDANGVATASFHIMPGSYYHGRIFIMASVGDIHVYHDVYVEDSVMPAYL